MKTLSISTALVAALGSAQAIAQSSNADGQTEQKCHVIVDTDKGNGGMQVKECDGEVSVGAGGPIKVVDWDHPAGKGDAFLPKAGRDSQTVVQDAGHGVEHATHEVGKAHSKAFGW